MNSKELQRLVEIREMAASGEARRIRVRARLSIRELAEIVGVNGSTLCSWELGQHMPGRDKALAWRRALALLGEGR